MGLHTRDGMSSHNHHRTEPTRWVRSVSSKGLPRTT